MPSLWETSRRHPGGIGKPFRRLGLVSDTHGLCDPRLFEIWGEVDEILHAGDVGDPAVLERLGEHAPVFAVRGNVDVQVPGLPPDLVSVRAYSPTTTATATTDAADATDATDDDTASSLKRPAREKATLKVLTLHVLGEIDRPMPAVAELLARECPRVVHFGHTHRPRVKEEGGRLFVNPGSAGPRRYGAPRTCGLLTLWMRGDELFPHAEIFDLETKDRRL